MHLLEIVYEGGDVFEAVFAAQRRYIARELQSVSAKLDLPVRPELRTVDFRRMNTRDRGRALRALAREYSGSEGPGMVLIRGTERAEEALRFFCRSPVILDHYGNKLLSGTLYPWSQNIRRVITYSIRASNNVREAGIGKVSRHGGPFLPHLPLERPGRGKPVIGLIGGADVRKILIWMRKLIGERAHFVSMLKDPVAEQVENPIEVAESCDLLVAPHLGPFRLGHPHEGAILALSVGRALCTAPSPSLAEMPYPQGTYIPVLNQDRPAAWASAFAEYLAKRQKFDSWPDSVNVDLLVTPKEIVRRFMEA